MTFLEAEHLVIAIASTIAAITTLIHLAYVVYYAAKHDLPLPPEVPKVGDDK